MSIRVDIMNDAGDVLSFERCFENGTLHVHFDLMDSDTEDPTPPAMKVSLDELTIALRSIGIG